MTLSYIINPVNAYGWYTILQVLTMCNKGLYKFIPYINLTQSMHMVGTQFYKG